MLQKASAKMMTRTSMKMTMTKPITISKFERGMKSTDNGKIYRKYVKKDSFVKEVWDGAKDEVIPIVMDFLTKMIGGKYIKP